MIELKIGYFDSRADAQATDLSHYDEIFTFGFRKKNDGGGGHYKLYSSAPAERKLGFSTTVSPVTRWGLVPDGNAINPLQAGAYGDDDPLHNDRLPLQDCIDFIKWWHDTATEITNNHPVDHPEPANQFTERDSSQTRIKLLIPGNKTFRVDRTQPNALGLSLTGPITIEGEDRLTSRIHFVENTEDKDAESTPPQVIVPDDGSHGSGNSLFYTSLSLSDATSPDAVITGITFRNFTITGSYDVTPAGTIPGKYPQSHGVASMVTIYRFDDVLFEDMVFERSRAVVISGGQTRNFTLRGCLLSECRRGGVVITDAENVVIKDNDFRWVADDPVALTMGADPATPTSSGNAPFLAAGGRVQIVGNRVFGCRGLNVNGSKNVLIADNTSVLCRGRAIHVGCVTDQSKGDTTTLNVIVRGNFITDQLDSGVDPELDQVGSSHRAIDIEMLQTAPYPVATPGWPNRSAAVLDPTAYYYKEGQGLQGKPIWRSGKKYVKYVKDTHYDHDVEFGAWWLGNLYEAVNTEVKTSSAQPPVHTTPTPDVTDSNGVIWHYVSPQQTNLTPYSGNIVIEGNIISRSRPSIAAFTDFGLGYFGGFLHRYDQTDPVGVTLDEITPNEGIAVSGPVRNLIIRGNQIRNCTVGILFDGRILPLPFSLIDVRIENNDISDWEASGVRFVGFSYMTAGVTTVYPQRVAVVGNRGDGDPLHRSAKRNTDGTWQQTSPTMCIFIETNNVPGLIITGNHVRNVFQLVAGIVDGNPTMEGNVGYFGIKSPPGVGGLGYNMNNVGIGTLIAPQLGWRYINEDGDPGSADYGKVLNPSPLAVQQDAGGAPNLPATSNWVEGTIVANLKPDAFSTGTYAGLRIWAWRRVTTGSGNAVPANWLPLTTKG